MFFSATNARNNCKTKSNQGSTYHPSTKPAREDDVFDRPGVAVASLQTALLLIKSFTYLVSHSSFVKISSNHCLSPTVKARDLKF